MKTKTLVATTAALLIAGCSSSQPVARTTNAGGSGGTLGQCTGVNACKGTSSCATSGSTCAGQNACKGKGWLPLTKKDCSERSGRFSAFNRES